MNSLTTQNSSLAYSDEQNIIEKINLFEREVLKILKTFKAPITMVEYKYILAFNRYIQREFNQFEMCAIPEGIIARFQDKSYFLNNNFIFNDDNSVLEPYIIFEILRDTDIDSLIESYISSIEDSPLYVDSSIRIFAYINVTELCLYNTIYEYINESYPNIEVVSYLDLDSEFDQSKNKLVDLSKFPTNINSLITNFKEIMQNEIGLEGKIPYFAGSRNNLNELDINEILGLCQYHGFTFNISKSLSEVYGNYLGNLCFTFNPNIKTFYEYTEDLFTSPSCVFVHGLTPFIGVIKNITLSIECINIVTQSNVTININNNKDLYPVEDSLNEYIKEDYRNLKTMIFGYNSTVYRVIDSTILLNMDCYVNGIAERLNKDIKYANNISVLGEHFGFDVYTKLLKTNKKNRETRIPGRYIYYVLRKHRLTDTQIDNLDIPKEHIAFWSKNNFNIKRYLEEITKVVSIDTLIENKLFDGDSGFRSNSIVLKLKMLGADSNV